MSLESFRLVEFTNPSGETVFRVDGTGTDGKRIRKNFQSRGEATGFKQRVEAERLNMKVAPMVSTRLSPIQLTEAEQAFTKLGGKSLIDAVEFFLTNHRDSIIPCAISDAVIQFVEAMKKGGMRERSVRTLLSRCGYLAKAYGSKFVNDIQPQDLKDAIGRGVRGTRSQINDRAAYSAFFSWAITKQYCEANPISRIASPGHDSEEIEYLTVEESRRLVSAAAGFKGGILLPYVTLALFCGIRPAELNRLRWTHIDLENASIVVGEKVAKTRSRRTVDIPRNALEWLTPHALQQTPIVGTNWRRYFDQVKEAAGFGKATTNNPHLKSWTPDVMRHTAITMFFYQSGDEGRTAQWAGNSPDVIHGSYKGILKGNIKKIVAAFWDIVPDKGESNIIRLAG